MVLQWFLIQPGGVVNGDSESSGGIDASPIHEMEINCQSWGFWPLLSWVCITCHIEIIQHPRLRMTGRFTSQESASATNHQPAISQAFHMFHYTRCQGTKSSDPSQQLAYLKLEASGATEVGCNPSNGLSRVSALRIAVPTWYNLVSCYAGWVTLSLRCPLLG